MQMTRLSKANWTSFGGEAVGCGGTPGPIIDVGCGGVLPLALAEYLNLLFSALQLQLPLPFLLCEQISGWPPRTL